MREYAIETYPSAYVEFGLTKEEFINLTFAEYQDMLIIRNYHKTLEKENQRLILINALTVLEINKNPKQKRFKDIEMFKADLEMYDNIFNGFEDKEAVKEHVKKEKQALLAGLGLDSEGLV